MPAEAAGRSGPWVLALDIGTSSTRGLFYDSTGASVEDVPVLRLSNRWRVTPDGAMEASPGRLLAGVVRVIDAALARARDLRLEVAGVAVASFWHSLLGLGARNTPVTPLYGWGDTRAAAVIGGLEERLAAEVHHRTGCFLDASYPFARLFWLRQAEPGRFRRAVKWLSFGEYLGYHLFGELRCSLSMASGTGLLDGWALRWDAGLLEVLGLPAGALSPLVDIDMPYRGLCRAYAERWPELAAVPWYPALGDGACANLGSGATGRDSPGLTLGTTAAVRVLAESSTPVVVPEIWCYRLDARRVVAGRALSNGGNAVMALERWLRLAPAAGREAELAALEPDAHGLTVLPFLVGERGPAPQPPPGAGLVGLTLATTPLEILRAWLEAVAVRIAGAAAPLAAVFGPPRQMIVGGGALSASPAWRQILADALGCPLHLPAVRETTARGAALVALEQLGYIGDAFAAAAPSDAQIDADAGRHARYRAAAERQRALAAALAATAARPG